MMNIADFSLDCTGDVVAGDTILWTDAVYSGSTRRSRWRRAKPRFLGDRRVAARVLREERDEPTFSLIVLWCEGVDPLTVGDTIRRQHRSIYRIGTLRQPWDDEASRRGISKRNATAVV